MNKLKIIQCYTGVIAKDQIRMIAEHPYLELVGALVFHEEKVGLDIGNIAGIDPLGIKATNRPLLENMELKDVAGDQVYEFLFLNLTLPIKGATGSPVRPIAVR